jgi:hypothetical protein
MRRTRSIRLAGRSLGRDQVRRQLVQRLVDQGRGLGVAPVGGKRPRSLERVVDQLGLREVAAAALAWEHQESAVLLADVPSEAARDRRANRRVTDPRGCDCSAHGHPWTEGIDQASSQHFEGVHRLSNRNNVR